jgi:hypothetical protein
VKAVMSYEKAITVERGMAQAHRNLGAVLEALDLDVEAARSFERYLAIGLGGEGELALVGRRLEDLRKKRVPR